MFNSIKQFFEEVLTVSSDTTEITEEQLRIATAALLIEMMHMDNKVLVEERDLVANVICKNFSLSAEQAADLMTMAEQQLHQATDYYQFTSLINKGFTHAEKSRLITCLWEVAFIDGELDAYEDYMVRKVSDLLHIPHSELIKIRNQVKKTDDHGSTVGC